MRRFLFVLFCAASSAACLSAPPVHDRAKQCNELCAIYLGQGDLTRAEVQCDLGLQFSPSYADLWVNKGLIALRRNQIDRAKELFIKALRHNQEQAQAYNNLGYIYLQDQAYGKAHDNFQRALKVNPDYLEARYNLALAFYRMGDKEKAKKELRTIIAVNTQIADVYQWLGVISLEEKNLDDAIANLRAAVELEPDFADAWMNLGNAYSESSRFTEAYDCFVACIEKDPKNAICRNNVAIVQRKALLQNPALKEAERNTSGDVTATALYAQARALRDRGLRNEEERAYRKCVRMDGRFAPCHFGLHQVYFDERKTKEAEIACQNFLKFALPDEFPKEIAHCETFLSNTAN
jgi:tetratricopeptide (TPR) repeat protein